MRQQRQACRTRHTRVPVAEHGVQIEYRRLPINLRHDPPHLLRREPLRRHRRRARRVGRLGQRVARRAQLALDRIPAPDELAHAERAVVLLLRLPVRERARLRHREQHLVRAPAEALHRELRVPALGARPVPGPAREEPPVEREEARRLQVAYAREDVHPLHGVSSLHFGRGRGPAYHGGLGGEQAGRAHVLQGHLGIFVADDACLREPLARDLHRRAPVGRPGGEKREANEMQCRDLSQSQPGG